MAQAGIDTPITPTAVRIPMRDGALLAADVFLPTGPGPFPAVFDYYPYRKDDYHALTLFQHRSFAAAGIAALRVEVRGTGGSEGAALDEYLLQEQLDAEDVIAWVAAQSWCNGRVGMFGGSYGGFNALQVAMRRPPSLRAICPTFFTDNRYTDDCHYKGGTLQMLFDTAVYGQMMVVLNALPPPAGRVGERWAAMWDERLAVEPWQLHWLAHQTLDDYWRHGSLCEDYEAITCATLLCGGWRDGYVNCNLRTFGRLRCPKKLFIGPWLHVLPDLGVPGPRIDYVHEMVRFFRYWLADQDDGVMDEPPITLFVQRYDRPLADRPLTSGFWRHEATWPLPRAAERSLYLGRSGRLEAHPDAMAGSRAYMYNPTVGTTFGMYPAGSPLVLPVDQRLEEMHSLSWTSEPLDGPLEILGQPHATLYVSVGTSIATMVVRLIDIAPDGAAALITKGVLNLTHRDSHERPEPLVPGECYRVDVALDATSWEFAPGHALRLSITGADFPNAWPSPFAYTGHIHLGESHPSRLALPVVVAQEPSLPVPNLRPAPALALPTTTHAEPPTWRVTQDHLAGSVAVELRGAGRTRDPAVDFSYRREALAVAYADDPARATVRGVNAMTLHEPQRAITAESRTQITSTASDLHVTIQLSVTIDELPFASRTWARSYRRHLL
jgi:hypothetical protein